MFRVLLVLTYGLSFTSAFAAASPQTKAFQKNSMIAMSMKSWAKTYPQLEKNLKSKIDKEYLQKFRATEVFKRVEAGAAIDVLMIKDNGTWMTLKKISDQPLKIQFNNEVVQINPNNIRLSIRQRHRGRSALMEAFVPSAQAEFASAADKWLFLYSALDQYGTKNLSVDQGTLTAFAEDTASTLAMLGIKQLRCYGSSNFRADVGGYEIEFDCKGNPGANNNTAGGPQPEGTYLGELDSGLEFIEGSNNGNAFAMRELPTAEQCAVNALSTKDRAEQARVDAAEEALKAKIIEDLAAKGLTVKSDQLRIRPPYQTIEVRGSALKSKAHVALVKTYKVPESSERTALQLALDVRTSLFKANQTIEKMTRDISKNHNTVIRAIANCCSFSSCMRDFTRVTGVDEVDGNKLPTFQ